MINTSPYPHFYRKANLCLKRESDIATVEIRIPELQDPLPLIHRRAIYSSKKALDHVIGSMASADKEVYENYLAAFFQIAADNAKKFSEYRQRKYAAATVAKNPQTKIF